MNQEQPSRPKDFELKPSKVERERGRVTIPHAGYDYVWFLNPNNNLPILVNGNERDISRPVLEAMKLLVRSILGPEL